MHIFIYIHIYKYILRACSLRSDVVTPALQDMPPFLPSFPPFLSEWSGGLVKYFALCLVQICLV